MRYILILALSILAGCATIVRGTEQQISVNTNPTQAHIEFSNGQSCLSPCTITTKRDTSLQINISKDGCATQTATMVPTLSGGGVILGGLIDYGTGAVYDLQPNPLTLTLACQGGLTQATLTPATLSSATPRRVLGIGGTNLTPRDVTASKMPDPHGAMVTEVAPGTAAEKAGLRRADIIQSFNGHRVSSLDELNAYVNETIPGTTVHLGVWRAGQAITLDTNL